MFERLCASLLLVLAACGGSSDAEAPLSLDWYEGQVWHLAATHERPEVRSERTSVDLDGNVAEFGPEWSDELVWTYQVVDSDFTPDTDDILFDFAITPRGKIRSLDVVRAWLDPSLNDGDSAGIAADPVVYLVFTHQRQRLAGIVSYTTEGNQRIERAYSSKQLGRSWSALSQSALVPAPTYLAPWGVRLMDSERRLENGSWLSLAKVDDQTVDAIYDDVMGGGAVSSRYEVGQPWPTWTVATGVEITLLDEAQVNGRRRRADSEPPEDYDFRAGLSASVDIDAVMALSDDALNNAQTFGAPSGYQPWNGNWWPQSSGKLVFGFTSGATLSDDLREDIDPLKTEMDELADTLREEDKGSEAYTEAHSRYTEAQDELVDKLVDFYNGLQTDFDGGQLRIDGDSLVHTDGRTWLLDNLSPMDKVAVVLYANGHTYPNPFYIPAWELLNHYSPAGGSWWGHCNGWSAAAILTDEPTEAIVATVADSSVSFSTGDVKGLLSETHYSTHSQFYGARYYDEDSDLADLTPEAFHRLITFYLRDQQVPLVFDTDAREQVWNFPAYAARVTIELEDEDNVDLVNLNTANLLVLEELPGVGPVRAAAIIDHRELWGPFQQIDDVGEVRGIGPGTIEGMRDLVTVDAIERTWLVTARVDFATDGVSETHVDHGSPADDGFTNTYVYRLVTDADNVVLRGTWNDEGEHPDFAWVPTYNPSSPSGSENYYLPGDALNDALGTDLTRR